MKKKIKVEVDNGNIVAGEIEPIAEKTIDNKLELLQYVGKVQSRIKDEITSDFTLAKLEEKDKQGIIEMTSNAYFVNKIMNIIKNKGKKWDWNNETKKWKQRRLNDEEKETIDKIRGATFDGFMNKIFMTVVLNRNKANNDLLKILAGQQSEEELEDERERQGMKDKIKDLLKSNKNRDNQPEVMG